LRNPQKELDAITSQQSQVSNYNIFLIVVVGVVVLFLLLLLFLFETILGSAASFSCGSVRLLISQKPTGAITSSL
jgi:hypothetical protein